MLQHVMLQSDYESVHQENNYTRFMFL